MFVLTSLGEIPKMIKHLLINFVRRKMKSTGKRRVISDMRFAYPHPFAKRYCACAQLNFDFVQNKAVTVDSAD
jgi:hypothetical protein